MPRPATRTVRRPATTAGPAAARTAATGRAAAVRRAGRPGGREARR
ncbi:hypothetical protein [Bailinhaonella thermotolerans]|nr:hypothetical protein [Bailinhaonella thermotolerans]